MKNIKEIDFKNKHRTKWQDFLWKRFLEQFSDKKSRKAVNSIFSIYEKSLITKRLAALALIRDGVGTKDISRLLWLSRTTISALKKNYFSNALADYSSPRSFKKLPKSAKISVQTSDNDWLKDLFGGINLWELIKNPPRPTGMGIKNR